MTVSTTASSVTLLGDGVNTTWPYAFPILDNGHVKIQVVNTDTGAVTTLSTSDYSITGIGEAGGGEVTYPLSGDPLSSDERLIIKREVPYLQETDIQNQEGFFPEVVEDQFDLDVMMIQQISAQSNRTIRTPVTDKDGLNYELDVDVNRANKYLFFGSDGSVGTTGVAPDPNIFDTRAEVTGSNIISSVDGIRTLGYTSVGDGGGALYKRVGAEPSHEFKVQSNDGAWWEGVRDNGISVLQLGATGDGSTDDTTAIQNALDAVPVGGGTVFRPTGSYSITSTLTISVNGTRFVGLPSIYPGGLSNIIYNGAQDDAEVMLLVQTGTDGVTLENHRFDANELAGICVHIDATGGGDSTHRPVIRGCDFEDYRVVGLVHGGMATKAEMDGDTVTLNSGTMQQGIMEHVRWKSQVAGSRGWLVNAQNLEWAACNALTFVGRIGTLDAEHFHLNHIYVRTGNLAISGLDTTGIDPTAANYGIKSYGQVVINGWRTEDRYIYDQVVTGVNSPIFITGLTQRAHAGQNVNTDEVIRVRHLNTPTYIQCRVQGSIRVAAQTFCEITAKFELSGADFIVTSSTTTQARLWNAGTGHLRYYRDGKVKFEIQSGELNTEAMPFGRQATFNSGNLNSGGTASAVVVDNRAIDHSVIHVWEIFQKSSNAMKGYYRVFVYRLSGGNTISSKVVTDFDDVGGVTITVTDNGDTTYDIDIANGQANNKKFAGWLATRDRSTV